MPTVDLMIPLCSGCLKRWERFYRRWLLAYGTTVVALATTAGYLAFSLAAFQKVYWVILAPTGVIGIAAVLLFAILMLIGQTKPLPIQFLTSDTSAYVRFRNPRFVELMSGLYQAADVVPSEATG